MRKMKFTTKHEARQQNIRHQNKSRIEKIENSPPSMYFFSFFVRKVTCCYQFEATINLSVQDIVLTDWKAVDMWTTINTCKYEVSPVPNIKLTIANMICFCKKLWHTYIDQPSIKEYINGMHHLKRSVLQQSIFWKSRENKHMIVEI
jgi:hypothetical protein